MEPIQIMESFMVRLKLSDQSDKCEDLIKSFEKLSSVCKTLAHFGPQHDWKDRPYNGYRSIVKLCNLFTLNVLQPCLENNKLSQKSLVGVTKLLIAMSERAITFSQETEEKASAIASKMFIETKQHFPDIKLYLKDYWGYHTLFWMTPNSRWVPYTFSLSTSLIHKLPKSLLASVSSEEFGTLMTLATWRSTPFFPLNTANYVNNFLSRTYCGLFHLFDGVDFREILVPRQSKWIVSSDGSRFTDLPETACQEEENNFNKEQNKVQCYLMKRKSLIHSGDVILHAQGGGFILDARQFHEAYLRDWASKLEGAVILNVIYSRFARYPCPIQEIVDVYLWLIKGNEDVVKALGFKPKRIICVGDSAGFLVLFSLCCVIRDIQLICPSDIPIYPKALMGICPLSSLGIPTMLSSFLLSYVDVFLCPSLIMHCFSLYSSGVLFENDCFDLDNNNVNNLISSESWLKNATPISYYNNFYNTWIKEGKSWHDCDQNKFDTRITKIASRISSPYISPLISYDLNLVSDLELCCIATDFDPFLDMSVELAKRWKGKLFFDVLEDLPHGFYGYYGLSNECRKATEICFQKLKDLCL